MLVFFLIEGLYSFLRISILSNWDKINEEFVDYIFQVVSDKRRELKAYFGDEYKSYIK